METEESQSCHQERGQLDPEGRTFLSRRSNLPQTNLQVYPNLLKEIISHGYTSPNLARVCFMFDVNFEFEVNFCLCKFEFYPVLQGVI